MDERVSHDWDGLRQLCARLRAPGGCSWDRAQTIRTLTPYLLEESHELLDAIASDEDGRIAEEIGDLLYLLISVLTIAEEEGRFRFPDVAAQTTQKLIRRHPHVFGADGAPADPATARRGWESIKRLENESRPAKRPPLASGSERLPARSRMPTRRNSSTNWSRPARPPATCSISSKKSWWPPRPAPMW